LIFITPLFLDPEAYSIFDNCSINTQALSPFSYFKIFDIIFLLFPLSFPHRGIGILGNNRCPALNPFLKKKET